jgi:dynein heavy chain
MSQQLEETSNSIYNGKVPELWKASSYPSLKPLAAYIKDLKERILFFDRWIKLGIPNVFWINKFYFTQGFLTGALQNYARKVKVAIDLIDFDFEVLEEDNPPVPQDGINVKGMYLEGAKWNKAEKSLGESDQKILYADCPMLWLKPKEVTKMLEYSHYSCPLYKTSERKGVLSTTGHSTNFVMLIRLPSIQPQQHWIKRGVALLTQLDN